MTHFLSPPGSGKSQKTLTFVYMESTAPNRRQQIAALLKRYWGFDTFRPVQEQVILSVLAGRDTLALMPTGGGKSLTYQIPGLASEAYASWSPR